MARNRIINWLDKKRVEKTEEFYPDLGDELIGALLRANLAEPLDGEDRLSDFPEDMQRRVREGGP
jgi:hypothetical protein